MEHPHKRTKLTEVSPLHKCKSKQCMNFTLPPKLTIINQFRTDIQCQNCNKSWVVCKLCNKRFSLSKLSVAENHFKSHHGIKLHNTTNMANIEDNFTTSSTDYEIHQDSNANYQELDQGYSLQESIQDINNSPLSASFKNYLIHDAESKSKGLRDIIGSSFFQSSDYPIEPTDSETKYHLQVTKFLLQIPTTLHLDFLAIINQSLNASNFRSTRLPETTTDISKIYLSGKSSIYNLLPVPKIIRDSEHAFVSLIDIIHFHVAFIWKPSSNGQQEVISTTKNVCRHVYDSYYAKESRKKIEATIDINKISLSYLYLIIWSDDFEPNHIRKNKHSTWIRSVTIYSKEKNADENTYILSLGHKSENHNTINENFIKELEILNKVNEMYCGHLKCTLKVVTQLLVYSGDRPERTALNHIQGHTGLSTRRWKHASFINEKTLPSCPDCLMKRIFSIKNKRHSAAYDHCRSCSNWNYFTKSRTILKAITEKYPRKQHKDSPRPPFKREVINVQYLEPMEQDYEWLKAGCRFCFHNVYFKVWNKSTSDEYMSTLGLSKNFNREYIVSKAEKLYNENPDIENPSENMCFPPMWNTDIKLYQYIDTPMHLLFQGITKSVIELTFDWIKLHNKLKSFGNFIDPYISNIKSLQMDFCRIETFMAGGEVGTAGWIGESFLGFSRCISYIFSQIGQFISEEFHKEKCAFEFLHQAFYSLISRLMSSDDILNEEINDYIKLFLSSVDLCEKICFYENIEDSKIWFKRSNFLCLLNLPEQIYHFGPIRNYWEGSRERIIQSIKPFMKRNRDTSSFLKIQLEKYSKIEFLSNTLKTITDESEKFKYERYRNQAFYNSLNMLNSIISAGKPFGCIRLELNGSYHLFATVKKKKSIDLYSVKCNDDRCIQVYGMYYTPIKIIGEPFLTIRDSKHIKEFSFESIICLPIFQGTECLYCIISNIWQTREKYGKFTSPSVSNEIFAWVKNNYM